MEITFKNKAVKFWFVAIVALVSINLWSFKLVDENVYKALEALVVATLVVIVACNSGVLIRKNLIFKNYVHLFLWIPVLSALGAYFYHDQSFNLSLLLLRTNFIWLLYFVLHIFDIPKERIIKLLLIVGGIWIFLTVIQQFTYPTYFFYSRDEQNNTIYRANVYRFMIAGRDYGLFFLLYFFYRYLTTSRLINLLYVAIAIAGFYYYGTRQFAIAAAFCMCVSVLYLHGRAKWKYMLLIGTCIAGVLIFGESLFGSYIELTKEQMQNGDNIRILSANFFLNEYWPGWGARILGNGMPHLDSAYGREMFGINTFLHYYRSDVGIIGAFNQFGIFYVINILVLNIAVLRLKFADKKYNYLKLFFINALILLVTNETYSNEKFIPFYCFILYIIGKVIQEQKQAAAEAKANILPAMA